MKFILLFLFLFLFFVTSAQDNVITIGTKHTMQSKLLGEERGYWIGLPDSYYDTLKGKKSYPVLILLDGDSHFQSATSIVSFLASMQKIPEMIVVAIPNTFRMRDLTPDTSLLDYFYKPTNMFENSGGGNNFLRFIHEELLVQVDKDYRTTSYQILVGHSLGGLLAIHSMLYDPKPFDAYIAIDPSLWYNKESLTKKFRSNRSQNTSRRILYVSVANNSSMDEEIDSTSNMRVCQDRFYSLLQAQKDSSVISTFQAFQNETHPSVPFKSMYEGLLFVFEGYSSLSIYSESTAQLEVRYANLSKRLGIKMTPTEDLINTIAINNVWDKHFPLAIEYFQYNIKLHPSSSNYNWLAYGYLESGNNKGAIEAYKNALKLNPGDEHAKKELERLKK